MTESICRFELQVDASFDGNDAYEKKGDRDGVIELGPPPGFWWDVKYIDWGVMATMEDAAGNVSENFAAYAEISTEPTDGVSMAEIGQDLPLDTGVNIENNEALDSVAKFAGTPYVSGADSAATQPTPAFDHSGRWDVEVAGHRLRVHYPGDLYLNATFAARDNDGVVVPLFVAYQMNVGYVLRELD